MHPSRSSIAVALNRHDGSDYSLADSSISIVCSGPYILFLNSRHSTYEARLMGHKDLVHMARFIPRFGSFHEGLPTFEQEKEILSCSADKTVRAWSRLESSSTWICSAVLEGHTDAITGLAVISLPDGSAICASASADCSIRVWQRNAFSSTWRSAARIEQKRSSVMISVALSILPGSNGVIMAAGGTDQKVHLYSISSVLDETSNDSNNRPILSVVEVLALQGHSDWIRSLSFSRQTEFDHHLDHHQYDNNSSKFLMLASGAQDGKIRLWRISERSAPSGGGGEHTTIVSSSSSSSSVTEPIQLLNQESGESDNLLSTTVFDAADEDVERVMGADDPDVAAMASAKMSSLSPADFDRMLLLMDDVGKSDSSSHALLRRPSTFSVKKTSSSGGVCFPALFDVAFDSLLRGHEGWVFSTRWHPPVALALQEDFENNYEKKKKDVRYRLWQPPCLISSGSDKTVTIWQPRGVNDPSLNTDPSNIWNGVWEPLTRVGTGIGSASLGMYGAILLSDAKTVVAHGFHGALHVWTSSSSSSSLSSRLSRYPLRVLENVCEFGQDGKHAITSWTAHSAPSGHFRSVTSLSWAPNGQYLLSSSDDSTSRVWGPVLASSLERESEHQQEQQQEQQQWHEISRPQIHGYAIKSVCIPNLHGRMHRFFSGSDEKVIRSFDAPELFLSTLADVCGPALESSGYGPVQDDISGNGEDDDGLSEPFKRASFAYVPELGLTNKAVMAALGSKDAEKATQDRYNLDGSDAISQSHDSNAQALRNFAQESGTDESLEYSKASGSQQKSKSSIDDSSSSSSSSSSSYAPSSFTVNKCAAPMEEVLVQDSRWPESEKMFGHVNEIISVAASSNGSVVASSCSARDEAAATLWLWDARSSKPIQQIVAHKLSVEKIEFSHALCYIKKVGGNSISSDVYCVQQQQQQQHSPNTRKGGATLDSEFFITSGRDRFVGLFTLTSEKRYSLVNLLEGHKRQVWSVSVAPIPDSMHIYDILGTTSDNLMIPNIAETNVRLFASGARDHSVRLWSLSRSSSSPPTPSSSLNAVCVGSIQFDSAVSALAFAPICRASATSREGMNSDNLRFATTIRTLLCVGLESGRLELYNVIGERTSSNSSWEWTSQRVLNNVQLINHTGAVQAMSWRPPPLNQCTVLTLATGGSDGAIIWHEVRNDNNDLLV